MANKVSFIIQLKDQFSNVSRKVEANFRNMERSARNTNRELKKQEERWKGIRSQAKRIATQGAVMTAAITTPFIMLSKSMIDAASNAQETADKFRDVFDGIGGQAEASSKRLSASYKLADSTSKELLSSTAAILSASGMQKERVLELSEALNGASIDLSSFHNFQGSAADASMILSKALLGEAESLKTNFGITIQQNKAFQDQVKQKMRVKRMTQAAAKAEVIFAEIMRQAGKKGQNALGNFAKTQESYANQVRISQEASKQLSESFGVLMLPIATKLIKAMTKLSNWVGSLSPEMKNLVLILGGLLAVAGPLLIVFGAMAAAMTFITGPMILIGVAIAALIVAGSMLYLNWERVVSGAKLLWEDFTGFLSEKADAISNVFTNVWESIKVGLVSFVNMGISHINMLLAPLDFVAKKLGVGGVSISAVGAPSTPTQTASGTLNGNITVTAEGGAKVKDTSLKTTGTNLNVGMNMMAAL